jgi:hypothetical protein
MKAYYTQEQPLPNRQLVQQLLFANLLGQFGCSDLQIHFCCLIGKEIEAN